MVRRPLGYFGSQNGEIHWFSLNLAEFHYFLWNVVKFGDFCCLGDGYLDFTRSSMKTQSILGLLRCFSRPDRYFSLKSTHFRWFSLKSPKIVEIRGLGREIPFWGEAGGEFHQFRTVITVVFASGAKGATFHPKTPKTPEITSIINSFSIFTKFSVF